MKNRYMQPKIDEIFAEKIIPEDDSVRLLDDIVDELDARSLTYAYSNNGRPPAIDPVTLLKIVLYANMEGIYSSRAIESACRRDINFMWLLNGQQPPSYHTIARFRSQRLSKCSKELFYALVKGLKAIGEIEYEHLFVDGTKIEANANKYTFVWKKSVTKYEAQLDNKLSELVPLLCTKYGVLTDSADELKKALRDRVTEPFVHGTGKRKSVLQKDIEQLEELLSRKQKYIQYGETFKGRNSFSKTDPDATFMHMKEDHMRNSQLKPGYNVQLGVEGEYITGLSISSERSDQLALIPLLNDMKRYLAVEYKDITADAGYESEENYTYLESSGMVGYIKPQNYEKSKKKGYKNNIALRENMVYNAKKDEYTCKAGRTLRVVGVGTRKSVSGFVSELTKYECESCDNCLVRSKCTKSSGNRRLDVSKRFVEQRERSLKLITSEKGKLLRINRSIQSEGAFGVIKQNYAFRQFLLRGNKKVMNEMVLVAMAYNINKLHAKKKQNRTGIQLFEKLTA